MHTRTMTESSKATGIVYTETATVARCVCGRKLTSAQSIARGMGPVCYRRILRALVDLQATYSERQLTEAAALLATGSVRRDATDRGLYLVTSGTATYYNRPATHECSCEAAKFGRACKHTAATRALTTRYIKAA